MASQLIALAIAWLLSLPTGCSPKEENEANDPALPPPALHAPEAPETPQPEPRVRVPRAKRRGDQVVYTIARGGTLLNVANLYKIHHHQILDLNPGVDPDRELPPDSEVLVYKYQGEDSESLGAPHQGSLVGGMPMLDGPGRRVTAERWKTWATRDTVLGLDRVLRLWARKYPNAPEVLVGNLSSRQGGPLAPHKTHQSGRDVDLSYIATWDGHSEVTWQHMSAQNLDAARTWALLKLLVKEADIEVIFIDRKLQRTLLRYARKHGVVAKARLAEWLEVASSQGKRALVRHVPGHADHMHVRFACPEKAGRCRS